MVEHWTFRLKGPGVQNHLLPFQKQFHSPQFACLSEETLKAFGPFYLVSMPGEVKDPMQENEKTCKQIRKKIPVRDVTSVTQSHL